MRFFHSAVTAGIARAEAVKAVMVEQTLVRMSVSKNPLKPMVGQQNSKTKFGVHRRVSRDELTGTPQVLEDLQSLVDRDALPLTYTAHPVVVATPRDGSRSTLAFYCDGAPSILDQEPDERQPHLGTYCATEQLVPMWVSQQLHIVGSAECAAVVHRCHGHGIFLNCSSRRIHY